LYDKEFKPFEEDWQNFDVLFVCDELYLEELFNQIQDYYFSGRGYAWLRHNMEDVLSKIHGMPTFDRFKRFCVEQICETPDAFLRRPGFLELDHELFEELIARDDLQTDEANVWDYVIRWGIFHVPELEGGQTTDYAIAFQWTREKCDLLKEVIGDCIFHVRMFEISMIDFYIKVNPLKDLLSAELYDEIIQRSPIQRSVRYPPRRFRTNSIQVTSRHAAIIAGWIFRGRSGPTSKTYMPRRFVLLYRGSQERFSWITFRRIWRTTSLESGKVNDNVKDTRKKEALAENLPALDGSRVVAIKLANQPRIVGGFSGWIHDSSNAFLFSFTTGREIGGHISRVRPETAEFTVWNDGVRFGKSDLILELFEGRICSVSCTQASYEKGLFEESKQYLPIEEIEIFEVLAS
jgi:hypothetical protein